MIWIQAREEAERGHRRLVNLFEIAATRVEGRRFGEQNLGEPEDDRQLVLEVVAALVG